MLPGVITQPEELLQAGEGLVDLDFILGEYYVDGFAADLSEVIDHPEWAPVNGLEITGADVAEFIGDALAHFIAADWTLIVEFEFPTTTTGECLLFTMEDDPFDDDFFYIGKISGTNRWPIVSDTTPTSFREEINTTPLLTAGIHRFAVTRTNDELAFSFDGEAVNISPDPGAVLSVAHASLGGFVGAADPTVYFRSLLLLEPQASSLLPTFSAI